MKSNSQNNVVWLASYLKSVYKHVLMLLNITNTYLYKCLIMFWIKYQSRLSHNVLQQWEITIRYLVTFYSYKMSLAFIVVERVNKNSQFH